MPHGRILCSLSRRIWCDCRADARDDSEQMALLAALEAEGAAHFAACRAAAGDDSMMQAETELRAVQQRHAAVRLLLLTLGV